MTEGDGALEWRRALKSDQAAIDTFVCTEPPKPQKSRATGWQPSHPRMYEYDAQQMIRSLRVPARAPVQTWVIVDDGGLVGVCSWTDLGQPGYVHMDVVGVAMRHRELGSEVGCQVIRESLTEIEAQAVDAGAIEMYVECEIFNRNKCSLRLMQEFGMTMAAEAPTGAQTWALRLPLASV